MSTSSQNLNDINSMPQGKRRLIEAAIRLAAQNGELTTIGLRELGREAGLNPNTFYRHFKNIEDLGKTAITTITGQLRLGLSDIRRRAGKQKDMTLGSAQFFFDFVLEQPDAFRVGMRAISGSSPIIRRAMHEVLKEVADDITRDIRELGFAKHLPEANINLLSTSIVNQLFYRSLEFIDYPDRRPQIIEESVQFARMLFLGAQAIKNS